jgi:circadian clock protein KaiC
MGGAFDLSGLLASLTALTEEIGAGLVVFDGIDMLLSALKDERLERLELLRLDEWVRRSGMTTLITAKAVGPIERDQQRTNFLQFVTDCVVALEESVTVTTTSRRIRILKYRGSGFVANPSPMVIGKSGFNVLAFKGARLDYPTFADRAPSGIARLDSLLSGGYIRGSSILVSGSPGTAKSSLAASFAAAACARGGRALLVSFDESGAQIIANMNSIGLDLEPYVTEGILRIESLLSTGRSPEEHFLEIMNSIDEHRPDTMVIDPISSLLKAHYAFSEVICERLLDNAKARGITILCTSLLEQVAGDQEFSASNVSTVADTWIHLSYVARDGERNRALTIVKSRGVDHSNQVRELVLSASGLDLLDVYIAEGQVLMGSARVQREAEVRRAAAEEDARFQIARLRLDHDIEELQSRLATLSQELSWKQQEAALLKRSEDSRLERDRADARARMNLRRVDDDGDERRTPHYDHQRRS